jgi:hypothetical protein
MSKVGGAVWPIAVKYFGSFVELVDRLGQRASESGLEPLGS